MRVGQARKRDANEAGIVAALRAIGVLVFHLNVPGLGDLLTYSKLEGYRVLEVKARNGTFTKAQAAIGMQTPVCVVRSIAEALALFGVEA